MNTPLNLVVTDADALRRLSGIGGLEGFLRDVGGVLVVPFDLGSDADIWALLDRLPGDLVIDGPDLAGVTILVGDGVVAGFGGCPRIGPDRLLAAGGVLAGMRDSLERFGVTYELLASEALSDGPQ